MRRIGFALILVVLAFVAVALLSERKSDQGPTVLAAASMQESLEAVADAWVRRGHPRPVLSFAATSALARQVEAGAPADLFISADEKWMDELASKHLIDPASRAALAGNALVLVAPAGSAATVTLEPKGGLADALGTGRLAMADPDAVPAGRYGKQALENLGLWRDVADRVAPADSVRGALALVSRGEAPFGVVYATDAKADTGVMVVAAFPPSSHVPIRYPLARLRASDHRDAEALRAFLLSGEARAILTRFGFTAP